MQVVDLDLTLSRFGESYTVAIQISQPGDPISQLAPPTPWPFDASALYEHELDPLAYGRALTAQLFSAREVRDAWIKAHSYAQGANTPLRLRLILPTEASQLHALRWETLHDPIRNQPLARNNRIWLVRLPVVSSLEPMRKPPSNGLRATIVVSSPHNLASYRLAVIDVDGEVARAQRALDSAYQVIVGDHDLAVRRQANLTAIITALRDAPDVLYLVCHGRIERGESLLCLESETGEAAWVKGSTLVEMIENLNPRPLLAILISCRSAGANNEDSLNVLGPQLAHAGIPAVLGFQGDVHQRTIRQFMPVLWKELRRNGRIDGAMATARHAIGSDMWWQPVLWLRALDGRLWLGDQPAPVSPGLPATSNGIEQTLPINPQLRDPSATLWFESRKTQPNWGLIEQIALQILATNPHDTHAHRHLAEAERQLDLQAHYHTIAQQREAGACWEDIATALEDLEREWPSFPDPESLQLWVAEQRRTAKLQPAIEQLRKRQSAHAALDMIERFLEQHPGDTDAASLAASIAEMAEAPFEQRLRAAQIAGQIGDPRFPSEIEQWQTSLQNRSYSFGQPKGYWCYVPSGTYRVGGRDEEGTDTVLSAFWIARYPITVAQYRQFIDDSGYHNKRWWQPEGWAARQRGTIVDHPWGWESLHFNQPNQPVIGVGWDEASAFCAWLSERLRPVLLRYHIRLPDENMWEVAARYANGQTRSYPWGEEEPRIDHAIHMTQPRQLRNDAPAPVGCCVSGAAACGALDMAGNVWELVASSWESYPQRQALPGPTEQIAWRGGAWSSSTRALRCTHRDRTRRDGHNYAQGGFRVIITRRD